MNFQASLDYRDIEDLTGVLMFYFCLFDLILYNTVSNFSVICRDGSSSIEPVLSKD